jgi:nicotinamidase/pyrazinamidase
MKMKESALIVVDPQRGFMPLQEGLRLGVGGFGELPIDGGEEIVPNVNRLLGEYAIRGCFTAITQDWHPTETAHFSDNPDYRETWPVHCVADTDGAKLHPNIVVPTTTENFKKGMEALKPGEVDLSYSGIYAVNVLGQTLGERLKLLRNQGLKHITVAGNAIDVCAGSTALHCVTEIAQNDPDFRVSFAIDAGRSVSDETLRPMLEKFDELNIQFVPTYHILNDLERED